MKNASRNEPSPDQSAPASAYEGRLPPEKIETDDDAATWPRPTGGVPSQPGQAVGPEADEATPEKRREAGGAPSERKESA
jgi:hypothetical protein